MGGSFPKTRSSTKHIRKILCKQDCSKIVKAFFNLFKWNTVCTYVIYNELDILLAALAANPNPAKLWRSDRIRIHNTASAGLHPLTSATLTKLYLTSSSIATCPDPNYGIAIRISSDKHIQWFQWKRVPMSSFPYRLPVQNTVHCWNKVPSTYLRLFSLAEDRPTMRWQLPPAPAQRWSQIDWFEHLIDLNICLIDMSNWLILTFDWLKWAIDWFEHLIDLNEQLIDLNIW